MELTREVYLNHTNMSSLVFTVFSDLSISKASDLSKFLYL
jgi:hypothetical protein